MNEKLSYPAVPEEMNPGLGKAIVEIREVVQQHLSEEHLDAFDALLLSTDLRIQSDCLEEEAQFEPTWL